MTGKHARGLLLRLAGPLQSWGTHSKYLWRDTARFPTRSGVVGMLASGLGRERGAALDDLTALSMTVRVDRPGVVLSDYHTVGGGLPADEKVITASGKRRSEETGTLASKRHYLADASFTLALTSDDADLLHVCAAALRDPYWPLFLGRRSCPPEGPVLLGAVEDPLHHLVRLPLAAKRPHGGPRPIDFYSDRPLGVLPVDSDAPPRATAITGVVKSPTNRCPSHRWSASTGPGRSTDVPCGCRRRRTEASVPATWRSSAPTSTPAASRRRGAPHDPVADPHRALAQLS
ncbi:hypothetical protein SCALM49S_03341 [Streptomyces californicus]